MHVEHWSAVCTLSTGLLCACRALVCCVHVEHWVVVCMSSTGLLCACRALVCCVQEGKQRSRKEIMEEVVAKSKAMKVL